MAEITSCGLLPLAFSWHACYFWIFALLACGFAAAVLIEQNVVRMALYLIVSLAATAGLFMLAGAQFVGAMQIMIYVGGTLVLLVFGVMLTAQSAFVSLRTPGGEWVLAFVVGGGLLALLVATAYSIPSWRTPLANQGDVAADDVEWTAPIGLGLIGVRVDKLAGEAHGVGVGGQSGYLLPFEAISVHLLVVLIGAAYLARTKVQLPKRQQAT